MSSDQICVTCKTSCSSAARNGCCSLRCSWKSTCQCVQCGRQVRPDKLPFGEAHADFKTFCGPLCLDEARRGSWCIACGVKQVTTQGLSRCSNECMAADVPLPHESPFPSRRTTPGEDGNNINNQNQQQQQNNNNFFFNNNTNNQVLQEGNSTTSNNSSNRASRRASFSNNTGASASSSSLMNKNTNSNNNIASADSRPTVSTVHPGSKLWDRITTPFHRAGLQCYQVIQINNSAVDKKAYNAYRLAVDQKLVANKTAKWAWGGEGNEHKRFVPLMAGCGGHLYGLRLAQQFTSSSSSSMSSNNYPKNNNHHHNNNYNNQQPEIEGYPFVCSDPTCDVCRILSSGLKLTSVAGRTSHFSVPTLDSVLPWCADAASTINAGSPQHVRFQAAALVRTVLGNVNVVGDFDQVSVNAPPQGFDSVVCCPESKEKSSLNDVSTIAEIKTDSAFTYNDQGILAEYIVLFTNPNQQF